MKANIHPDFNQVKVTCVCGNSWETYSTTDISRIDICSNCHPFYSGKQKVLDTEGRIEKFKKKYSGFKKTK